MGKKHKKISYGPHDFPWGPEPYIRKGNLGLNIDEAHKNIVLTLANAFADGKQSIPSQLTDRFDIKNQDVRLNFINYGDTQLVYLATFENGTKLTTLINQPHTPLGRVKREFTNLKRMVQIDSRFVVEPFSYFAMEEAGHELYVSQYVDNAMCVAVNGNHGVYDPLPNYHFEEFSPEMSLEVNSSMIALLVKYYDEERQKGLAKTQVSGNDFILTRDFNKTNPSTILPNMKLISARDFVNTSLDGYLDMLRQEFLIGTNYDSGVINARSKMPMTKREIEIGIEKGLLLR
ncbi:MAG: hypothetical protein Q8L27_02105 [archaeon]|nr:hypothetical protein [archaeon]